ncbi:hypothetical protein ABT174_24095 [Streptomyces sparsogenes]|uniref:hypothetical protein n=1 Tax=Streptomyces sparsogenes TaxID=67365 RepID=UPI0033180FA1
MPFECFGQVCPQNLGIVGRGGLAGRHRRRRHRTTIPDPHAAARPDLVLRGFRPDPSATDAR